MHRSQAAQQQNVSVVGTETGKEGGSLTAAAASAIVTALFLPPSSSDFDGPVLALAIVILLLILHHVAFAEHVAVGDDRDVAEDVLAAVHGLDEPEATRVPPCGLPLQTLTAPATATTAAAIAVVAAAGGAAGARTPATFDPQL
jgi:hypothetical protein